MLLQYLYQICTYFVINKEWTKKHLGEDKLSNPNISLSLIIKCSKPVTLHTLITNFS